MWFVRLVPALVALISLVWRTLVSAKDRELGRAEATRNALEKQAADNKLAVEAFDRAEHEHAQHPNSEDAYDQDFVRKE